MSALRDLYGDKRCEYWNAGVESFSTVQEVRYYKRFNWAINPDHVILTFHTNDFETTPAVFVEDGKIAIYALNIPLGEINPWLFSGSYLYRQYIRYITHTGVDNAKIRDEVRNAIKELQEILKKDKIQFTVLILPTLSPYADWPENYRQARDEIKGILKGFNIKNFDLLAPLEKALQENAVVTEVPGDTVHPSDQVAHYFARYLYDNKVFGNTVCQ